jgi:hypothetical protein
MVYAIANPCSSHLVEKVHHWPGVESLTAIEQNLPLVASKPARFFDKDNADLRWWCIRGSQAMDRPCARAS